MSAAETGSLRRRAQLFGLRLVQPNAVAILVLILTSVAVGVIVEQPIQDPDGWWVAAAGRELLRSGTVPRVNLYSFTDPEHPWVMHEWLLGPLYAAGLTHFGPGFFVGLTLLSFGVAMSLLVAGTVRRTPDARTGLAVLALFILCFGKRFFTARPTSIALLLPLLLTLVAFAPRFRLRHALGAVAIVALWTNVHGSFPLGVALLGLSAIERRRDRELRALATAAAALVTLVNPYGLELHRLVLGYLLGAQDVFRVIHRHIDEFRSLFGAWGTTVGAREVLGLALVAALALAALGRPVWRWRGVFCLLLVALALKQARHVELAGLLSGLLLVPLLERYSRRLPAALRTRRRSGSKLHWFGLAGVPLAFGALVALFVPRPTAGSWLHVGAAFLSSLERVEPGSHLLVPFGQGGLIAWYGFPRQIRTFIDPRNDCYSAETFDAFWQLNASTTPAEQILRRLDEHRVDEVLVPADHPLGRRLPGARGWTELSRAGDWLRIGRRPVPGAGDGAN